MKRLTLTCVLCLVSLPVVAQTTVVADRFRLNTGPCLLRSGSGSPEGVLSGRPCDMYVDTASGVWYTKWTGTATTTGWGVGHNAAARINGNTTITGYVGEPNFVSQLTTWRIDNTGAGDFRYLYADELHAKSFIADLEQALAGGQIICKSVAVLASNFTNPATSGTATLTVRDLPSAENMAAFQSGDYVGLRSFSRAAGSLTVAETFGVVTAYADQAGGVQTWTFTRGAGANGGGLSTSAVVATDAIVIDYGTTGNGCHEINAIDGAYGLNSPYAQTWTWTTSPIPANRVLRTRLGNQRGITAVSNEYGLIAGTYAATNGTYLRATNSAFELHGIDLSLWQGATKTFFVDHAVPSLALGAAVPSGYATGTGIWMGNDGGTYKFRAGVPNGAGLFWDGSTLTVRGTTGAGRNQIRNSECRTSTEDWTSLTNSGLTITLGRNYNPGGGPFRLQDEPSTCYIAVTGTPANGTVSQGYESPMLHPVQEARRYEASAHLGTFSTGNTIVAIQWNNAAGAFISQVDGTVCTTAFAGGAFLSGYCRSGIVATAPSGAATARVVVQTTHNGSGVNPFVFWVRSFFGEATSTQTELTDWGPGGITEITGGLIKTGTILAEHIATNTLTANEIAANAITTSELNADSVTSAKIVAGTIVASDIAAGTITADRLSVSTLSAISGNIGTITSGTIIGVTIEGGEIFGITSISGTLVSGTTVTANDLEVINSIETTTIRIFGLTGGGNKTACVDTNGDLYTVASGAAC